TTSFIVDFHIDRLFHAGCIRGELRKFSAVQRRPAFRTLPRRHPKQVCYDGISAQEGAVLTDTVPDILAQIVARKQLERSLSSAHLVEWERQAAEFQPHRRDFRGALLKHTPAVIAEIKKASPSKGLLSADFDPAGLAREYEAGGAAALSVLTDQHFFQGSLANLRTAREAVKLPVLRKDFTLDEYHVVEAAAHGADAILLIVAILDARRIRTLRELAAGYGMSALVETHDEAEVAIALEGGA